MSYLGLVYECSGPDYYDRRDMKISAPMGWQFDPDRPVSAFAICASCDKDIHAGEKEDNAELGSAAAAVCIPIPIEKRPPMRSLPILTIGVGRIQHHMVPAKIPSHQACKVNTALCLMTQSCAVKKNTMRTKRSVCE